MKRKGIVGFVAPSNRSKLERGDKARGSTTPSVSFERDTYYMVQNFGYEKGTLFSSQEDYDRFEAYLYILNAVDGPRASNFFLDGRTNDVFSASRGEALVSILAYSFTTKSFTILLSPVAHNGISRFMQKLQTAYTMYVNLKYSRKGKLFAARYIAHAATHEQQLKCMFAYVLLCPATLFEENWMDKEGIELEKLAHKVLQYRYSSAFEFVSGKNKIIHTALMPPSIKRMKNARTLSHTWMSTKEFELPGMRH